MVVFQEGDWLILFNKTNLELKFTSLRKDFCTSETDPVDHFRSPPGIERKGANHGLHSISELEKLTISVTDCCNLACDYCYLKKKSAKEKDKELSGRIAFKAINRILEAYCSIHHVNFFGGEPLLNVRLIREICSYFRFLKEREMLGVLPDFGITTNGTILNNEIIDLLDQNSMQITISLDGPMMIHDKLRRDRQGCATFERIDDNIKNLIRNGYIPEFECTYTMQHYKKNITINDLLDFFYNEYNCSVLHVPMVVTSDSDPNYIQAQISREVLFNSIDYSISNLFKGINKTTSFIYRLTNCLSTQTPVLSYCPAIGSSLAINTSGSIYPCGMLSGDDFFLGDFNVFNKYSYELLKMMDRSSYDECKICWAKGLCFGCLAEDYKISNRDIYRSSSPGKSGICDMKRDIIEYSFKTILKYSVQQSCQN
jgi:uncharacterized protein